MKDDDQVCLCFHVTKRKIRNYIRIQQPRVVSQISECGGAGTGCGWCIPFLKRYFKQAQEQGELAAPEANTVEEPSAEEYAQMRGEYIKSGKGTPPPGATPPPQ